MDLTRLKQINQDNARKQREDQKHLEGKLAQLDLQETVVKSFSMLVDYLEGKVTKTLVVNQLKEIATPDALKVVDAVNSLHDTLKTHENTGLKPIEKGLGDVVKSIKAQKYPEYKTDNTGVEKLLKKTNQLLDEIADRTGGGGGGGSSWVAVNEDGTPVPIQLENNTIATPSYDLQVDDTGTYTYLGNASPGTATSESTWRIKRVVNATGVITHADGTASFTKSWDSRAGYTY